MFDEEPTRKIKVLAYLSILGLPSDVKERIFDTGHSLTSWVGLSPEQQQDIAREFVWKLVSWEYEEVES